MTTYKKLARNTSESNCVGDLTKITTFAECQQAGAKLGLGRGVAHSWRSLPSGCFESGTTSYFGTRKGNANMKHPYVSAICKTSGGDGSYEILSMGKSPSLCPNDYSPILSKEGCLQAAKDLKLSNPSKNYMNFNTSYAPVGCLSYKYNNSTFWFNPSTTQSKNVGWGNMAPVCKKDTKIVSVGEYEKIQAMDVKTTQLLKAGRASHKEQISQKKQDEKAAVKGHEHAKIAIESNFVTDLNTTTSNYNAEHKSLSTSLDKLKKYRDSTRSRIVYLNADLKTKIAEIKDLASQVFTLSTDKNSTKKRYDDEIARLVKINGTETARLQIYEQELTLKISKLEKNTSDYNTNLEKQNKLNTKYAEQIQHRTTLQAQNVELESDNIELTRLRADWQRQFTEIGNALINIEAEITAYLNEGKKNLEYLEKLLAEKRDIHTKLFKYTEELYNSHTQLIGDTSLEDTPIRILGQRQTKASNINKTKVGNLKNDLSTLGKNIQINQNMSRKKSFYIFLLTQVFIGLIIIILVFIASR